MSLTGYDPSAGLVPAFCQGKVSVAVCLALLSEMTGVCFAPG